MSVPPQKPRVLIVEDESLIADLAESMLSELGCQGVGPIVTVEQALQAIASIEADAAILNLILHDQSADSVAEALAARGIPFGIASGMDGEALNGKWKDRPFIQKPYMMADMRGLLRAILPAHAPPEAEISGCGAPAGCTSGRTS